MEKTNKKRNQEERNRDEKKETEKKREGKKKEGKKGEGVTWPPAVVPEVAGHGGAKGEEMGGDGRR